MTTALKSPYPDYQPSVTPKVPNLQGISESVDELRRIKAKSAEQTGAMIESGLKTVNTGVEWLDKRQEETDKLDAHQALVALEMQGQAKQREYAQISGPDARGMAERFASDFDKVQNETGKHLNDRAKRFYEIMSTDKKVSFTGRVSTMESHAFDQEKQATVELGAQLAVQKASEEGDSFESQRLAGEAMQAAKDNFPGARGEMVANSILQKHTAAVIENSLANPVVLFNSGEDVLKYIDDRAGVLGGNYLETRQRAEKFIKKARIDGSKEMLEANFGDNLTGKLDALKDSVWKETLDLTDEDLGMLRKEITQEYHAKKNEEAIKFYEGETEFEKEIIPLFMRGTPTKGQILALGTKHGLPQIDPGRWGKTFHTYENWIDSRIARAETAENREERRKEKAAYNYYRDKINRGEKVEPADIINGVNDPFNVATLVGALKDPDFQKKIISGKFSEDVNKVLGGYGYMNLSDAEKYEVNVAVDSMIKRKGSTKEGLNNFDDPRKYGAMVNTVSGQVKSKLEDRKTQLDRRLTEANKTVTTEQLQSALKEGRLKKDEIGNVYMKNPLTGSWVLFKEQSQMSSGVMP